MPSLPKSSEQWKPVPGYAGLYEVSSHGQVRSLEKRDTLGRIREGTTLSPGKKASGHLYVILSKNGKKRSHYVHRIVLEAFYGPCPAGMHACHWNDNPEDNTIDNLRWDTPSANLYDALRNGKRSRLTRCQRGHEFSVDNTYIDPKGKRNCRECARLRAKRHADKRATCVEDDRG